MAFIIACKKRLILPRNAGSASLKAKLLIKSIHRGARKNAEWLRALVSSCPCSPSLTLPLFPCPFSSHSPPPLSSCAYGWSLLYSSPSLLSSPLPCLILSLNHVEPKKKKRASAALPGLGFGSHMVAHNWIQIQSQGLQCFLLSSVETYTVVHAHSTQTDRQTSRQSIHRK